MENTLIDIYPFILGAFMALVIETKNFEYSIQKTAFYGLGCLIGSLILNIF